MTQEERREAVKAAIREIFRKLRDGEDLVPSTDEEREAVLEGK